MQGWSVREAREASMNSIIYLVGLVVVVVAVLSFFGLHWADETKRRVFLFKRVI